MVAVRFTAVLKLEIWAFFEMQPVRFHNYLYKAYFITNLTLISNIPLQIEIRSKNYPVLIWMLSISTYTFKIISSTAHKMV